MIEITKDHVWEFAKKQVLGAMIRCCFWAENGGRGEGFNFETFVLGLKMRI